jgi:predicted enzyme related to lactoylglutathione lyase
MPGEPSHFEVGVRDAGQAKAFYGELLGWSFEPTMGENAWIETSGVRGGLHDEDDASNIVLYFRVSDIEAAVQRVRQLGGVADDPGPRTLADGSRRAAMIKAWPSGFTNRRARHT